MLKFSLILPLLDAARTFTPLSSYRTDNDNKKVLFSRDAPQRFLDTNFTYKDKSVFYDFTVQDLNVLNNHTMNNIDVIGNLQETFSHLSKKQVRQQQEALFDQFFTGPRINLEIKRSHICDFMTGVSFLGAFTREDVQKGQFIGHYNGLQIFGADMELGDYEFTELGFEYVYNGARDYMDAARYSNFMRFLNHQDGPNVVANSVFVPIKNLVKRGIVSPEEATEIPDYVEVMAFTALEDIKAGEELYVDYGPEYWNGRDADKVRVQTMPMISREMSLGNARITELEEDVEKLKDEVSELTANNRELIRVIKQLQQDIAVFRK